jgi:hypothetical protein
MDQALSTLSPAALAGLIVAYLLAASRIAGPLAPLWARLPSPWPQLAPAIFALLPQVADAFEDVNTWQSFAVSVATAIGLVLPGIMPKPPQDPPAGGERPVGPWVDIEPEKTPPSLPGVSRFVAIGWMALLFGGCGLFGSQPAEPPAKPPCDPGTAADMATQCAAEAALCVTKGGSEQECGAVCDKRADERAEQCR